jgi:hypothetical protein
MKNIFKKILFVLIIVSTIFYFNCETTDLDIKEDPNGLDYSKAQPDLLLNKAMLSFARFVQGMGTAGAQVTRLSYMNGRQYQNAYAATFFNEEWRLAYADVLKSIDIMKPIATSKGNSKHLAMAQVLEAYTMITLVDFFGDVPYSEALDINNLVPKPDSGASIYAKALALCDQAIVNFTSVTPTTPVNLNPANDYYYNKDWTKWIKLANTIKLKIYVQTRLVNANSMTQFNNIIASNNFISSSADDFQFRWSSTNANPDSRSPLYVDNYTPSGVTAGYQSNWLMNVMKNEKTIQDPRMRYYFYRQVNNTPVNEQDLRCSVEPIPSHYASGGHVYCRIPNNQGYWGRDHGNDEGIPPDRQKRTANGVYPAGGRFDGDNFAAISSVSVGGQGAGITTIILASTIDFWRAEMALLPGGIGDAKALMTAGIQKSLTKVRASISFDPTAVTSFVPPLSDDTTYLSQVGTMYDAAPQKLEVIIKEFFITLFGNGIDAYNAYRRTGFPRFIQPNLEPNPGVFIRSFYYPASESNTNFNMPQKTNVGVRVFWDNNPTTGFPVNN